jgi:hypothetical protein
MSVSIKIQAYGQENLLDLSVELMVESLYTTIILYVVKQSTGVKVHGKLYEDNKRPSC